MVAEKITSLYTAEKKRHTTRGKGKGAVVKADTPVVAATGEKAFIFFFLFAVDNFHPQFFTLFIFSRDDYHQSA